MCERVLGAPWTRLSRRSGRTIDIYASAVECFIQFFAELHKDRIVPRASGREVGQVDEEEESAYLPEEEEEVKYSVVAVETERNLIE